MKYGEFTSTSTGIWALVWTPTSQNDGDRTILYLHGAGGFGAGAPGLYEHPDLPSLLRDGLELGCRVVIPSCHVGDEWEPSTLASFLDDLEQAQGKPRNGYDLVGYSRGGSGAYRFAATTPGRIRTLAVISAKEVSEAVPHISGLPVFICHGLLDQRAPVDGARRMHEALRAAGCNSTLAIVEGDHFIVAEVFSYGPVFQWQRAAR